MVVSSPKDIMAFENAEEYKGLYHVLGGTISLSKGKGIDDLNIPSLIKRVEQGEIKEVIIATNPTVDGETTALYLAKLLENKNVNVTRLAYGLPMGGNLDYADSLTLAKAVEGRRKI
jgi:recombination protein RecR